MNNDEKKLHLKALSYFYPIMVESSENETEEEFNRRWDKFDNLTEIIKNKLSSREIPKKLKNIKENFNLKSKQIGIISRIIRSYYFKELKLEDFANILMREMGVGFEKAQEIANIIKRDIIDDHFEEDAYKASLVKMNLQDALKKYPEVGEQLVTSKHITLKNFPDPVRPSIKNWISDYTFNLGYDKHDVMQRMDYLFKTTNTLNLNSQEREKLEYILQSFDERFTVTINIKINQIVFPQIQSSSLLKKERKIPKKIEKSKLNNNVSFSFPQKLSYEKSKQPDISQQKQPIVPRKNNSLVDLKDKQLPFKDNLPVRNIVNLKK